MPDKYMKAIPKSKARRGDRVYYTWRGRKEFGYYVGKQKIHATLPRSNVVPRGCKKGTTLIGIWNPDVSGGGAGNPNVFLPLKAIQKVIRGYQTRVKGSRRW